MWPFLNHTDTCGCTQCISSANVAYAGPTLANTGIQNNDTLTVALQKIDNEFNSTTTTTTTTIVSTTTTTTTIAPYKSYVAILNQSATAPPIATVIKNTLGGTIIWSRVDTGWYKATLSGAFTPDKTVIFITNGIGQPTFISGEVYDGSGDAMQIFIRNFSGSADDYLLSNASIRIDVYN